MRHGILFRLIFLALLAASPVPARAQTPDAGKLKILLLGDSTSIGSICRQTNPQGPHLEEVIRGLLAAEKDLPPTEVVNQGRDGEYIQGLLSSGRYDREIKTISGVDFVLIRYGLNDINRRENFHDNFPKDYSELIGKLRKDYPGVTIIPMTIIPYMSSDKDERINSLIRKVGQAEKLPVFDVYTRYSSELAHGENMLNYRRYPLEKIPEKHREWVKPFLRGNQVVVMDNQLDAHFRELPGWFGDRHPNLAGYHVIGDETATYLARLIRDRKKQE
jgi:lysophospholipase L1-like esterase